MKLLAVIIFILALPVFECSIYVYNSGDSPSVEDYDCVYHQSTLYCVRPTQAFAQEREGRADRCYANGKSHSLRSLRLSNTSAHTVLHHWRSTLDQVEEYAHYLRQPIHSVDGDKQLCQCTDPQSFGRNCEYLLPVGKSLTDTANAKFAMNSGKLMYEGDIVCYTTVQCDFGLLCLDWRDICDGVQQCMSGVDEENCDKLEFNECEEDEYRCMNGMCIPDEYFLDGEYDCMDMSDEKVTFNDTSCAFQSASKECDDRVCPPNQWSCGDGQCIADHSGQVNAHALSLLCQNRRDQFFYCESVTDEALWTEANGRCSAKVPNATNRINYCAYLLLCSVLEVTKRHCPCRQDPIGCVALYQNRCSSISLFTYPAGGLLTPYAFAYINVTQDPFSVKFFTISNGTIKCRGHLTSFTRYHTNDNSWDTLIYRESDICATELIKSNISQKDYHDSCLGDSQTFNNRSYHWIDVCGNSSQCISAYRINDGFSSCGQKEDEKQQNELVTKACANVQRHRFRCSSEQATCLLASKLPGLLEQCNTAKDETSTFIQMSTWTTQCTSRSDPDCYSLRRLIEASWNHSLYNHINSQNSQLKKMPFRRYCDTFQDLLCNQDENAAVCQRLWICSATEWQCHTGQCIEFEWVLDNQWDCPDGSDEETMFAVDFGKLHPNSKWLKDPSLIKRFSDTYHGSPFSKSCLLPLGAGYFQLDTSHHPNRSRYCAEKMATTNDSIKCILEHDRDYVFEYCSRTAIVLSLDSEYQSKILNVSASFHFYKRCSNSDGYKCSSHDGVSMSPVSSDRDVTCWNGTRVPQSRCDGVTHCRFGEDEFLCGQENFWQAPYRRQKQDRVRKQRKEIRLPQLPLDSNGNCSSPLNMSINGTASNASHLSLPLSSNLTSLFNMCNRGIPVWTHNRSIVCFCPPQYHGEQCQYHTDRITFLLHVNYTYSSYNASTDPAIVHKFLFLFLADNDVMSTDEFHIRPSTEYALSRKKLIYLYYSRSAHYLQKKRDRYRNRSDIIAVHPFSIRIEAYEMKPNASSRRFAVWQYPIYFDYLPAYRFATVLRFLERRFEKDDDPCPWSPCGPNEECYRLQNRRSQHLCLCRSGFFGENCSQIDPKCQGGYCSADAICQSRYRGLVTGNRWPYCICPLDYIGLRCEISPNKCLEKPCRNGGTCYQRSKPSDFKCECTDAYTGDTCVKRKLSVLLYMNLHQNLKYRAILVRYMQIDYMTLELTLVSQRVFTRLPGNLTYSHGNPTAPEIVLLTLYYTDHADVYLISLRIGEKSISAHTSIGDHNRCRPTGNGSQVIEYHSICRSHLDVLCFVDNTYLCICEEDHSRVECFNYDDSTDKCNRCEAKGRCLKGKNDEDIVCLCPPCHEGRRCQFNLESFSFTLDQLFFSDLLSRDRLSRTVTYYSLLITPLILFLLGLVNNICCFVTFRRPRCLRNGTGHYLYAMSLCNQLNLAFLVVRLIHLTLNIASPYSSPTLDGVLCRTSSYLLTTSTRMTYWLSSLIGIERVYVALFVNGQWLKKPHIARRIIALAVVTILTVNAYQPVFIRSQISSDDGLHSMCTITFPGASTVWLSLHSTVTIIDSVAPFCINLLCTVAIICLVTKKKMNATRRDTSECTR